MNNLLTVPVLLPMLGAALTLILGRRPRLQRLVSILVLSGVVGAAAALAWLAHADGVQTLWVGAWPQGFGIVLVADRLSAIMLTVAGLVLRLLGRVPEAGDMVEVPVPDRDVDPVQGEEPRRLLAVLSVERMDGLRIDRIALRLLGPDEVPDGSPSAGEDAR